MNINVKRNTINVFDNVTTALCVAYSEKKYILVERKDFQCIICPISDTYTIIIDSDGIDVDLNEFIEFKNPDLYDWTDCIFTVIEREQFKIVVSID